MPTAIGTITELTGLTANAWTDYDVTSLVGDDAGNLAAVILITENTVTATEYDIELRANGSTDDHFSTSSHDHEDDAWNVVCVRVLD